MVETLRNMFRRKSRTFLTVFGIVIGIFALAVMGSLAEKMNGMISGGVRYYTGQITVSPKGGVSGGLLSASIVDKIQKIKGVKQVHPEVMMLRDEDPTSMGFGMPPMVIGFDLSKKFENRNYRNLALTGGRRLKNGDSGKVLRYVDPAGAGQEFRPAAHHGAWADGWVCAVLCVLPPAEVPGSARGAGDDHRETLSRTGQGIQPAGASGEGRVPAGRGTPSVQCLRPRRIGLRRTTCR